MSDAIKGRLLTLREAAPLLGYASFSTLYTAIRTGAIKIETCRLGSGKNAPYGIYEADIDAAVAAGRHLR